MVWANIYIGDCWFYSVNLKRPTITTVKSGTEQPTSVGRHTVTEYNLFIVRKICFETVETVIRTLACRLFATWPKMFCGKIIMRWKQARLEMNKLIFAEYEVGGNADLYRHGIMGRMS